MFLFTYSTAEKDDSFLQQLLEINNPQYNFEDDDSFILINYSKVYKVTADKSVKFGIKSNDKTEKSSLKTGNEC